MKEKLLMHSELAKLGPVRVKVGLVSPEGVQLEAKGERRLYKPENAQCAALWVGQEGKEFTVVAEGAGAKATVTYVGESGAKAPPVPQKNAVAAAPANPDLSRVVLSILADVFHDMSENFRKLATGATSKPPAQPSQPAKPQAQTAKPKAAGPPAEGGAF